VPCYPGELNQVFLNIIVNAAHAIGDVVKSSGPKGRIAIRTWPEESAVVVAISDSGAGIPESARAKLFDPFFTTKELGKGTGQGLAIARSVVVDKHQGSITFTTELGKGTTFFIRLPLSAGEKASPAAA
jgi:two-component system NtrC family sensor kinase